MRKLVTRLKKADLPPGTRKRLDYPPFDVLIVNLGGVPYAIDDTCNHAGESLFKGDLDGCEVVCPAHGYVFDVRTGHLIQPVGLCESLRVAHSRGLCDHGRASKLMPLPMRPILTRWRCAFCQKWRVTKSVIERHERICWQNPQRYCDNCQNTGEISVLEESSMTEPCYYCAKKSTVERVR